MSSVKARMGVVVVACCAARIAASPATMMTSAGDLNSSAGNAR
jgi:hypothetical protein